ncbi:ParB/RepB/Spo0J family partition protein [Actibacterium sp. MT2.3-13A]|uniref:ParB/RepB/Spo0J family partition protein n=1 Tax=Actibacterium sp. MT2.3-13A TaxID=2828332 RepID=UPI001BA89B35|nr:ParB/RepB/Spo0J family partition protein [Actibacterium sp. MT2.3-13A]
MAKRKRLTPPNPDYLGAPPAPEAGLETKALYPMGVAPGGRARPAPPIADVAAEASATAALNEVTQSLTRAREEGRMVLSLPLEAVQLDYLVRDRIAVDDGEMTTLMESLRARGQQTPIEVAALGGERYGLISGWRRCHALRRLQAETGDGKYGTVLALLRRPEESSDAYLAMVEENEIRVGLSYYERARIAAKSVEQGVFETEKQALLRLYHAASRAKRSKIRSFLTIVQALDGALRFPEAMGERAGLILSRRLEEEPDLAPRLRAALDRAQPADAAAERACLEAVLTPPAAQKQSLKAGIETKQPLAPVAEPCPGVRVTPHADGRLTLSGPGVTGDLRARLLDWLSRQG